MFENNDRVERVEHDGQHAGYVEDVRTGGPNAGTLGVTWDGPNLHPTFFVPAGDIRPLTVIHTIGRFQVSSGFTARISNRVYGDVTEVQDAAHALCDLMGVTSPAAIEQAVQPIDDLQEDMGEVGAFLIPLGVNQLTELLWSGEDQHTFVVDNWFITVADALG